jgi:hypothetical protein
MMNYQRFQNNQVNLYDLFSFLRHMFKQKFELPRNFKLQSFELTRFYFILEILVTMMGAGHNMSEAWRMFSVDVVIHVCISLQNTHHRDVFNESLICFVPIRLPAYHCLVLVSQVVEDYCRAKATCSLRRNIQGNTHQIQSVHGTSEWRRATLSL